MRLRHLTIALPFALVLAGHALAAMAQGTVYRCGEGGRSYSDTPCASGRAVDVADPRSAAQQQAAREAAKSDQRLADQLAQERRAREKAARGQVVVAGIDSPRTAWPKVGQPAPLKKPSQKKKKKGSDSASQDPNMSLPLRGEAARR